MISLNCFNVVLNYSQETLNIPNNSLHKYIQILPNLQSDSDTSYMPHIIIIPSLLGHHTRMSQGDELLGGKDEINP